MSDRILAAITSWRDKLLDLSKRNRLINCGTGRSGATRLEHPDCTSIWDRLVVSGQSLVFPWKAELLGRADDLADDHLSLFSDVEEDGNDKTRAKPDSDYEFNQCKISPRLTENGVLTRLTDKALGSKLQRLSLNAKTSLTEQGVNTLFVSFGLLRWYESKDSDVAVNSPLLLVPVQLDRSSLDSEWEMSLAEEEVVPNHCLSQAMLDSFALAMPALEQDALLASRASLSRLFDLVRTAVSAHTRWSVLDDVLLGNFAFQKLVMWQDLGKNGQKVATHRICRVIAGDSVEQGTSSIHLPAATELDEIVRPHDVFHIRECDSSQHEAIEAVKRGADLVLDGPPGTGKSQTIANLIAEFVAVGKTVLFVSEKAAALEVVRRRLNESKLDDFCLECHSHKANKRAVVAELGRCLSLRPEQYASQSEQLDQLSGLRKGLNRYVGALHKPRGKLGLTAYQVHGRLAALIDAPISRFPVRQPFEVDGDLFREMLNAGSAIVTCRPAIEAIDCHPWRNCRPTASSLTLDDDIQFHFGRLATNLTIFRESCSGLQAIGLVTNKPSYPDLLSAFEVAKSAARFPLIPKKWFADHPRDIALRYICINDESKEFQRHRASLPQFKTTSIDADWKGWFDKLQASDRIRRTLAPGTCQEVRAGAGALARLIEQLGATSEQIRGLTRAANAVLQHLFVAYSRPVSLNVIKKLLRVGKCAGRIDAARPGWFDRARREDLKGLLMRGQADASMLDQEEQSLKAVFCDRALDPSSRSLLETAGKYRSRWRRLFPSWRKHRKSLQLQYAGGAPRAAATLLSDASRLLEFLSARDALQGLIAPAQSDLLIDDQGRVKWEESATQLDLVHDLESEVPIPRGLRDALLQQRIDRPGLTGCMIQLESATAEAELALSNLTPRVDWNSFLVGNRSVAELPVTELADQLDKLSAELADVRSLLVEIAGVVCESTDIRLGDLWSHRQAHEHLSRLRSQIRDLVRGLGEIEGPVDTPEESDWNAQAALAKWLIGFLDEFDSCPPPALVAAATDPAVRRQLETSIEYIKSSPLNEIGESWEFLQTIFDPAADVSTGIILNSSTVDILSGWLRDRGADVTRMSEWISLTAVRDRLSSLGIDTLLKDVAQRTIGIEDAKNAFLARFYRLWLDAAHTEDPALGSFRIEEHEQRIEQFRQLDRRQIDINFKRIRERRLESALGQWDSVTAPATSEVGILAREVHKQRRHLPLRELFKRIPRLLQRIKPCLMMSPLAVSTYLDDDSLRFDVVIFDEASQVRPHDAICAIYRGQQLVVAGDQKQLPPTSFFDRQVGDDGNEDEDEEEGKSLDDFESILDVCATLGMPRKRLRWHYRSKSESLITFSNQYFYERELVTFPSVIDAMGNSAVRLDYVKDGVWQRGTSGGFNLAEAQRVAALVLEHVMSGSNQSLGVITMNQRQQFQVLDEIDKRRRDHPELEEFFDQERDEPFFVKNLENVQGDEREHIILTVGYAHDQAGTFAMRFGPLNTKGGERRLNVAVTRARRSLTVVSSIRATDIDLTRINSVGGRLLRAYLDYAERGMDAIASMIDVDPTADPDSPFEVEVEHELRKAGLTPHRQVGCGRFKIDLALPDPQHPGRYALGIECDGATYHSCATARDRDRLRQAVLERLGWRICRVWSTDWMRNRGRQVQKILAAYQDSLTTDRDCHTSVTSQNQPDRERPKYVNSNKSNGQFYSAIEDVPPEEIERLLRETLSQHGTTEREDLIVCVARLLGFQRTGNRIHTSIDKSITKLLRRSIVVQVEGKRLALK